MLARRITSGRYTTGRLRSSIGARSIASCLSPPPPLWNTNRKKIHRALNMSLEEQRNKRLNLEKKCNIEKSQEEPEEPPASQPSWNNLRRATVKKEDKRVHFNIENPPDEASEDEREAPVWHCMNGQDPQQVSKEAQEKELEELESRITNMREQLRAALVRKSELMVALGPPPPKAPRLPPALKALIKESKEER